MMVREGNVRARDIAIDDRTAKIRELNDALRRDGQGGMVLVTNGIVALGRYGVPTVYSAIAAFDAFSDDNDPHGEHDFGMLDVDGERIMFKIDYYDRAREFASPDPADPRVTVRVMTVMLASEY